MLFSLQKGSKWWLEVPVEWQLVQKKRVPDSSAKRIENASATTHDLKDRIVEAREILTYLIYFSYLTFTILFYYILLLSPRRKASWNCFRMFQATLSWKTPVDGPPQNRPFKRSKTVGVLKSSASKKDQKSNLQTETAASLLCEGPSAPYGSPVLAADRHDLWTSMYCTVAKACPALLIRGGGWEIYLPQVQLTYTSASSLANHFPTLYTCRHIDIGAHILRFWLLRVAAHFRLL